MVGIGLDEEEDWRGFKLFSVLEEVLEPLPLRRVPWRKQYL
jgi:hypothetical protein